MSNQPTRRDFLKGALAATTFSILPGHLIGANGKTPPSRKLNIAAIGVGGRGVWNLKHIQPAGHNLVAWADLDPKKARQDVRKFEKSFPDFEKLPSFTDYRVMLDKMDKSIDAVVVSIPDHSHFHAGATAIAHDKHVYLEKPLCHDIATCRAIAKMAEEKPKLVTQMGNQGNSSSARDQIEYWVNQGALGDIKEAYAYTCASMFAEEPAETEPCPEQLDWNLWLNRAQERPYAKGYHPFQWRKWRWFGSGMFGDWGCHQLNIPYYIFKLGHRPVNVSVKTDGVWPVPDSYPEQQTITWDFPAHQQRPPFRLTYYIYKSQEDRDKIVPRPPHLEPERQMSGRNDGYIIGSETSISFAGAGNACKFMPFAKNRELGRPKDIPNRSSGSHQANFFGACVGEQTATTPFKFGAGLTEMILLGEAALRSKSKSIHYDPDAMKVTNDDTLEMLEVIQGPNAREGWEV